MRTQNLRIFHNVTKCLLLFIYIALTFSCEKMINRSAFSDEESSLQNSNKLLSKLNVNYTSEDYCSEDGEDGNAFDSILKPTILGAQLIGTPYSVENMQLAKLNLTGTSAGISENKWYVRLKPVSYEQLASLDELDIDLFDYPLDYELIQEGDYYDDGSTQPEEIPWLYAVVDVNFIPPSGVAFELLQRMHVPDDYRIENEAFEITGNFVDTMDCSMQTILRPALDKEAQRAGCNCSSRPSALSCECRVACDFPRCITPLPPIPTTRIPVGNITVTDDILQALVAIKKVRMVARRFLKVDRTYTDNNGNYNFTKSFHNKVTILMKFKNSNATVGGLRGARIWQMLFPVKINMGKYRGNLNNVRYNVADNNDLRTNGAKLWAAATTHNAVQEYNYTYAPPEGIGTPPANLRMLVVPGNGGGSAPMFAKRYASNITNYFLRQFVIPQNGDNSPAYLNALASTFAFRLDVVIGYKSSSPDVTKANDAMAEVCFHELTHAAHYNKVGNNWYGNFVTAELDEIRVNIDNSYSPYGIGTSSNSPIIALGESWAYYMGHFLTQRKYGTASGPFVEQGITYSNNSPVPDLNSNLNLLEDFDATNTDDVFRWIPQGLYYDLFDNRNDFDLNPRRVDLHDLVSSYTNSHFFNALDNDILNLQDYRVRILDENANRDFSGVNTIFDFYDN